MMETNEEEDFKCSQQKRVLDINESVDDRVYSNTQFFRLPHQCVVFAIIGSILALSGSVLIISMHFNGDDISKDVELIKNKESDKIYRKTSASENLTSSPPELNIPPPDGDITSKVKVGYLYDYRVQSRYRISNCI